MNHKTYHVIVDRPLGSSHPTYKDMIYPLNYGYIKEYMAGDNDYQDAYVLGENQQLKTFDGILIAIIHRKNDNEDKWVVAKKGTSYSKEDIFEAVYFQEQYFDFEIEMI